MSSGARSPGIASGESLSGPAADAGKDGHLGLVEDYFDRTAQEWSELYRRAQRVNDLVLADRKNAAVAFLTELVPPGGAVLDAGCGAGLFAVDLLERGYALRGVDVSSKMIELAGRNIAEKGIARERYELSCSDVAGARFPSTSFDGIAALGFLQYQPDEDVALREFHRILRPGGTLVITGPTRLKISNWLGLSRYYYALRRRLSRKRPAPAAPPPVASATSPATTASAVPDQRSVLRKISPHSYSYGRFRKLLERAGFEVLACKGHGYVNYEIIGKRLGVRGEMFLHRTFTSIAKVLPIGRFANDIIVVAKKP